MRTGYGLASIKCPRCRLSWPEHSCFWAGNGGIYLVVPGVLISTLAAVYNAWVLLVEIKR